LDFLAIVTSIKSCERNEAIIAYLVTVLMERTTSPAASKITGSNKLAALKLIRRLIDVSRAGVLIFTIEKRDTDE